MPTKRQNRWYGLDGQSQSRAKTMEQSNGTRKLISLFVLLFLILILIQTVSDTKQVEKVGTAIGLFEPYGDQGVEAATETTTESDLNEESSTASNDWTYEQLQLRSTLSSQSQMQQVMEFLIASASPKEIAALIEQQYSQVELTSSAAIDEWLANSLEQLGRWEETLGNAANDGADSEVETIRAIEEELQGSSSRLKELPDDAWGRSFRLALDRRFILQMQDNQTWRESEHLISLRTWQRVLQLRSELERGILNAREVPRVEVMQLVSTSNNAVRGVPIRFRGTIALVDERNGHIEGKGWPAVDYRVLWLKPDEANSQPVTVYVPVDILGKASYAELNRTVEVIGFFTKKVAYSSQRGPETAPVLFAAALQDPNETTSKHSQRFVRWLRGLPSPKLWQPPRDFNKPFSLVMKTVNQSVGEFASKEWESTAESVSEGALQLLLAAQKHAPEIQQLCESDYAWPVAGNIKLKSLEGIATQVERVDVLELRITNRSPAVQAMQRAEQTQFFRITVAGEGEEATVIYCNRIPKDWMNQSKQHAFLQPFVASGFAFEESADGKIRKAIVVDDIRWKIRPNRIGEIAMNDWKPVLPERLQCLLVLGWDLSFRDELENLQSPIRPLASNELEPLFSLLRLVSAIGIDTKSSVPQATATLTKLLENSLAKGSKGRSKPSMEWISGKARVVRATKIPVEKAREQSWLGGDHYYELDCMADIGNVTLEMPTENEPIIYNGEYPITILTRELPDWLQGGELASGAPSVGSDELQVQYPRMRVQYSGWFYRFWSYKTQEMTQALGSQHRQIAPLVVSHSLQLGTEIRSEKSATGLYSNLPWWIGLAVVGVIWWFIRNRLTQTGRKKILQK
ncbi:MAG: hypothetical protein ACK52L_04290 [Pirellula sp.]